MISPAQLQMLCDAIDDGGRMLLCVSIAMVLAVAAGTLIPLFAALAAGWLWRRLVRGSWNRVVVAFGKRALRNAHR